MERASDRTEHNLVWRPMLIGKFGPLYDKVNRAWRWARLNKRTAKLGTYEGGFQAALEDIAAAARRAGATIKLHTPVEGIASASNGGLEVRAGRGGGLFDQVLCTVGPG